MMDKPKKEMIILISAVVIVIAIIVLLFIPKIPYIELTADIGGDVGESLSFTADVTGGASPYTYVFYFGDGSAPNKTVTSDHSVSVSHSYSEVGNYNMFVTIKDANDDISIDRQTVIIVEMPANIVVGDLLYMDFVDKEIEPGRMNDHVAMYLGNNTFIHAIEQIGVEIRKYAYFNSGIFNDLVFGYVLNASDDQKITAANWAKNKVGMSYQENREDSPRGENNEWYAPEMIWAAYNNLGINIGEEDSDVVNVQQIIKDEDTEIKPEHKVPNYVRKGDIILMDGKSEVFGKRGQHWLRIGNSNDHGGIYLGHDFRNGNYFIHASGGGVSLTTYEEYHFWCENFTFWYVNNANQSQRDGAVYFALSQLGAPYQYFFGDWTFDHQTLSENLEFGTKDNDPNGSHNTSDQWYCVELVWASYYNCNGDIGDGIDIDINGWEERIPDLPRLQEETRDKWIHYGPVSFVYVNGGNDIQQSVNTTQLKDLSVELTGKSDGIAGESLSFNINVTVNRKLPYNYTFYFSDGSMIENTSSNECVSVNHVYLEQGQYTVVVSVTDSYGSIVTDGHKVSINTIY